MNQELNLTKEKAKEILNKYIKTEFIIDHSFESAVIMQALAKRLGENEDLWYIIGLLHDLDMDVIDGNYDIHGLKTKEILEKEGVADVKILNPILAHTECLDSHKDKYKRVEVVDFALAASEQITGIITAYARMRPEKFEGIKIKSIKKKLKDKAFARNVNREFITDVEKIGIELNEFLEIAVGAIYEIRDEINI